MIAGATEKRGGVDVTWHMFRYKQSQEKIANHVEQRGAALVEGWATSTNGSLDMII
jgi:hypothetical protein